MFDLSQSIARIDARQAKLESQKRLERVIERQKREMAAERRGM